MVALVIGEAIVLGVVMGFERQGKDIVGCGAIVISLDTYVLVFSHMLVISCFLNSPLAKGDTLQTRKPGGEASGMRAVERLC